MKKETLYLDTSVPSAYYDKRANERQETTIKFWKDVLPDYQVYISEVTVEELEDTKDETLREKFRKLIKGFKVLKINEKIRDLARVYIEKGIFPEKYIDDALHVAIASFYEMSYLVSWNFKHLVKIKTRRYVNSVNILEGFKGIEIVSPLEI
ncbi:MAG: type II toxin-antitoxin system VapC family toxin [Nitrospirota bacterium]